MSDTDTLLVSSSDQIETMAFCPQRFRFGLHFLTWPMHSCLAWNCYLALFCTGTFSHKSQVVIQEPQNDKWQTDLVPKVHCYSQCVAPWFPLYFWSFESCVWRAASPCDPFLLIVSPQPGAWCLQDWLAKELVFVSFWNSPSRMGAKNPEHIPVYLWQPVLGMQG